MTIRQRRLPFAGFLARRPDERLSKRLFGKLVVGESRRAYRPEHDWLKCLTGDLKAFGATRRQSDGIESVLWTTEARKERVTPWNKGGC